MGSHHYHHNSENEARNISFAFFLNLAFTIIEIIGGILTNSVAILANALHDLGDSLSLGLAWYFQRLSNRGRDEKFSYGYKRFSILAALINSLILVVGSVFILFETIPRLINPEVVDAKNMIFLSILGVIVNGAAFIRLRSGVTLNEKVVSLHILEDVLGWIAVLVGSVIMYYTSFHILDPMLSIGIAAFILFNVYKNIRSVLKIFLQAIPDNIEQSALKQYFSGLDEIAAYHDLHLWSMDGNYHILTVHLVLRKELSSEAISTLKRQIRHELDRMGFSHVTMEFEYPSEKCFMDED